MSKYVVRHNFIPTVIVFFNSYKLPNIVSLHGYFNLQDFRRETINLSSFVLVIVFYVIMLHKMIVTLESMFKFNTR